MFPPNILVAAWPPGEPHVAVDHHVPPALHRPVDEVRRPPEMPAGTNIGDRRTDGWTDVLTLGLWSHRI